MSKEFSVEIVTPARKLVSIQAAEEVLVPTIDGEVGVKADHQDYIGILAPGVVLIKTSKDTSRFIVSSGVAEVSGGKLTILAAIGELPEEVDKEVSKQRLEEMNTKIQLLSHFEEEFKQVKLERDTHKARIDAVKH